MDILGSLKLTGMLSLTPAPIAPEEAEVGCVWLTENEGLKLCISIDPSGTRNWERLSFDSTADHRPTGEWIFSYAVTSEMALQAGTPHDNVILLGADRAVQWTVNDIVGQMKASAITDTRNWHLPDKSGTIALLSDLIDTNGLNAVTQVNGFNLAPSMNNTFMMVAAFGAQSIVIPAESGSLQFPPNFYMEIMQASDPVTFVEDSGVSLTVQDGRVAKTGGRNTVTRLRRTSLNTWMLYDNLATS